MFATQIANSMPQSESILPILMQCGRQSTHRSLTSFEPPPCSSQDPLRSPGPATTLLSYSLKLPLHPSIFIPSCISAPFFPLLDSLISISSLSFPPLHPAAVTKALFLPIHWRLVWSRTHARCSALRDRLTAHWGESEIEQERERKWERGEYWMDKKELRSEGKWVAAW